MQRKEIHEPTLRALFEHNLSTLWQHIDDHHLLASVMQQHVLRRVIRRQCQGVVVWLRHVAFDSKVPIKAFTAQRVQLPASYHCHTALVSAMASAAPAPAPASSTTVASPSSSTKVDSTALAVDKVLDRKAFTTEYKWIGYSVPCRDIGFFLKALRGCLITLRGQKVSCCGLGPLLQPSLPY